MKKKIFFIFILLTILTGCTHQKIEFDMIDNQEGSIDNQEGSIDNQEGSIDNQDDFIENIEEILLDNNKNSSIFEVEVKAGDNIWNLSKEQIQLSIDDNKWNELGEAKQTYLIDSIKDEIVENHSDYGINEDPDKLMIGTKIKFKKVLEKKGLLEHTFNQLQDLDNEQVDNIISNNQALIEAVDSGLELTNSNVDALIKQFK